MQNITLRMRAWHGVRNSGVRGGSGGESAPPKSCDLLKIVEKSLKIWAKSLNIWANSLISGKHCLPTFFDLKNGAQRLQKNKWRPFFFQVTPKNVFMNFVRENLLAKVTEQLFGQVWRNSGKNPLQP